MFEFKRKLIEFLKSPKKSIRDIEKFVTEYFINLLDRSRKAGLWVSFGDIKFFTQEEGVAFEKMVKETLEKRYE